MKREEQDHTQAGYRERKKVYKTPALQVFGSLVGATAGPDPGTFDAIIQGDGGFEFSP